MSKKKGTRWERQLFNLLWEHFGPCLRSAGSGCTPKPSPDLLASNGKRILVIECKNNKKEVIYLTQKEIFELNLFAKNFNAEPWLAIKFDNKGWYFIRSDKISKSKGESFRVSLDDLKKEGLVFDEFVGKYEQQKL